MESNDSSACITMFVIVFDLISRIDDMVYEIFWAR